MNAFKKIIETGKGPKNQKASMGCSINGGIMSDEQNLIKEVNEEIKQDEYNKLWKKYRTYIFSLVILVILFVSTGTFYKNYKIPRMITG